jgi:hypothetical protein
MISRHKIHYGEFDTPETLFAINPSAQPGLYLDSLNCVLARADAIVQLLASASADLEDGYTVDQRTIADAVWCLSGLLDQARAITRNIK